jgi:hypothetical protein
MTKAELDKVIVRSFPIYELLQIRIEGHRYPRRRICQQRLGFFDTKEHAEEAMLSTVEFQKRCARKEVRITIMTVSGFSCLSSLSIIGKAHSIGTNGLRNASLLTQMENPCPSAFAMRML